MSDPQRSTVLLDVIRARLTGAFPVMLRAVLDAVDDEGLWWRPAPGVNPIGVLVLHTAGSLRQSIGRNVGGIPYERDRPAEFDAGRRLPKAAVRGELERAIADAHRALDGLDDDALRGPSRDPDGRWTILFEDLMNAVTHVAFHTGQAMQLVRAQGGALPDGLWASAHRASGAMRG